MGIDDLLKVVREHAPNAIRTLQLSSLRGSKLAVDSAYVLISHWKVVTRQAHASQVGEYKLLDPSEIYDAWELSCLRWLQRLLTTGIEVSLVFDGPPHPAKARTKEERQSSLKSSRKHLDELLAAHNADPFNVSMAKWEEYAQQCSFPGKEEWARIRRRLAMENVDVFVAEHDGEQLAAQLTRHGHCERVLSADSDCLPYGAVEWLTSKDRQFQSIRIDDVLTEMGISFEDFLDLCIMLGGDYSERVRGFGPKKCWQIVKGAGLDKWQHASKAQLCVDFCREHYQALPDLPTLLSYRLDLAQLDALTAEATPSATQETESDSEVVDETVPVTNTIPSVTVPVTQTTATVPTAPAIKEEVLDVVIVSKITLPKSERVINKVLGEGRITKSLNLTPVRVYCTATRAEMQLLREQECFSTVSAEVS